MITMKLEAENLGVAEVRSVAQGAHASERAVHVKIDQTERWDAAGLLRLSALLQGVAGVLNAGNQE